jgi:hypothetical protein
VLEVVTAGAFFAGKETTMATLELPRRQQELIEKLARFRNGLEPLERQILDAVVRQACEPGDQPEAARPPRDGAPSEADVAHMVGKIEKFAETLSAEQRELFEELLTSGSHAKPDVEAHQEVLWAYVGGVGPLCWAVYLQACWDSGGNSIEYLPAWWSGGTVGIYRCWKW